MRRVQEETMANFVLVHGAWIGGWCWRPNAQALRKAGHEVFTPTLTGLGERSHLMNPGINLDTHIADIVNVFKHEELSDVVLVGHSYGGMVVTGVADALADKIRSLVYLDAFVPESGQALVDLAPPEPKPQPASDYALAPLPAAVFGAKPEVAAFVDARTSPHPAACFAQPVKLTGGIERIKRKTYIYANVPAPTAFTPFYEKARGKPGWTVHTLPCTHLVQVDMPNELTALLLQEV
jgi:pimeloyl-ACP methyl ester carboxylesterase